MYNTLRITGLASGIDTEEMIQNLMKAERIKVDRVEQDRQTIIWRQEMYNSLNKDFANFILNTRKMFGLTTVTRTGTFLPNSYQTLNWVKKATSSDETIATVSSIGKALDGTYKVNVNQLAEGVSLASGSDIRMVEGFDINDSPVGTIIISKDGTINRVAENGDGKILEKLDSLEFTINDGKDSFIIKVSKDGGITMNDVVKEINSTKDVGVRASYDANIGRFFLQTIGTGKDAKIEIGVTKTDELGNIIEDKIAKEFFEGLKLNVNYFKYDSEGNAEKIISEKFEISNSHNYQGSNAIIDFNGATGIEYESNRITINGITMDLASAGEFTINVATDVDGVYEKIEQFINDYNELVDKTNKLLGEKVYRDYRPLTADQRKAMEKEDIELWEEKAKSGLLRNDDIIGRTMLNIRRSLYESSDEFNGSFKLITEIGISTEQYSRGSAGGKLVINEEKLKEAIAKDPEGVMEFLFKESIPEKKDENGEVIQQGEIGGIITRVYDNLMMGMEDIIKKSGTGDNVDLYRGVKSNILLEFVTEYSSISLLDKDVLQFSRRIDDLNEILFRKENNYYAKFAAMEKAISRMNQQSMWLMQQFMG